MVLGVQCVLCVEADILGLCLCLVCWSKDASSPVGLLSCATAEAFVVVSSTLLLKLLASPGQDNAAGVSDCASKGDSVALPGWSYGSKPHTSKASTGLLQSCGKPTRRPPPPTEVYAGLQRPWWSVVRAV